MIIISEHNKFYETKVFNFFCKKSLEAPKKVSFNDIVEKMEKGLENKLG